MQKKSSMATPPSENQLRVMHLANNLRFPDDFDEYLARADSGGSAFGLLKRHAFAQSSLRVRPSPAALRERGDKLRQRRSKSLVPPARRPPIVIEDNDKCIMAALCQQTERRASTIRAEGRPGNLGKISLGVAGPMTLQVQTVDYRRHSSLALYGGNNCGTDTIGPTIAELKKRASHVYVDPTALRNLALQFEDGRGRSGVRTGSEARGSEAFITGGVSIPVCRRRSFSVTPRGGLVNEGDEVLILPFGPDGTFDTDLMVQGGGSRRSSYNSGEGSGGGASGRSSVEMSSHRVLMLGGPGVGKTALTQQFATSEFMAAQNTSFDDGREISVPVLLDGEESLMEFVDLPYSGELDVWREYDVDAYIVIYSITDRRSYQKASDVIKSMRGEETIATADNDRRTESIGSSGRDRATARGRRSVAGNSYKTKPIIVVANKSDLERSRMIGKGEGKMLAQNYDCKYIEVSAILNHKVDDLLVGMLKQIRLSQEEERRSRNKELRRRRSTIRGAGGGTGAVDDMSSTSTDSTGCIAKPRNGVFSRLFRDALGSAVPGSNRAGLSTPDRMHSQSFARTPSGRRECGPIAPSHSADSSDWDAREELRKRELEEVRARAAQMEKTMRWWSDCTANWREKWSKVRGERNQARDECRQVRSRLEASAKECVALRRAQNELTEQLQSLQAQLLSLKGIKPKIQVDCSIKDELKRLTSSSEEGSCASALCITEDIPAGALHVCSPTPNGSVIALTPSDEVQQGVKSSSSELNGVGVGQKCTTNGTTVQITLLQSRLDDALKLADAEIHEKIEIEQNLEKARIEVSSLTAQLEDLTRLKQDAVQEVIKLKQWKRDRMEQMTSDLEDESVAGSDTDKKLAELRKELEKLQAENAQEWASREKLESEKLALERENKKMRSEVIRLEEELTRRSRQASITLDLDMKTIQDEVSEKIKELSELRQAHSRLKKSLQDKTAELEHARSRAEHYELDVKKLRGRIEELKRELATAEDECDQQAHQMRIVQRSNDELQQQIEGLTLQLQHLQTRSGRSGLSGSDSRTNLGGSATNLTSKTNLSESNDNLVCSSSHLHSGTSDTDVVTDNVLKTDGRD